MKIITWEKRFSVIQRFVQDEILSESCDAAVWLHKDERVTIISLLFTESQTWRFHNQNWRRKIQGKLATTVTLTISWPGSKSSGGTGAPSTIDPRQRFKENKLICGNCLPPFSTLSGLPLQPHIWLLNTQTELTNQVYQFENLTHAKVLKGKSEEYFGRRLASKIYFYPKVHNWTGRLIIL